MIRKEQLYGYRLPFPTSGEAQFVVDEGFQLRFDRQRDRRLRPDLQVVDADRLVVGRRPHLHQGRITAVQKDRRRRVQNRPVCPVVRDHHLLRLSEPSRLDAQLVVQFVSRHVHSDVTASLLLSEADPEAVLVRVRRVPYSQAQTTVPPEVPPLQTPQSSSSAAPLQTFMQSSDY